MSKIITYPLNDIEYRAEDAELFHCTRTSGVWAEKSFTCSVSGEDNNVTVSKGVAWINNTEFAGKVVAAKNVTVLYAGVSDDLNDRIDVVAIQFDANKNETDLVIKHGNPVLTDPKMPKINRSGGIYELYLCSIYRTAGKNSISAADVTDLRLNAEYCGLMADSVTKIDTEMIENQIQSIVTEIDETANHAAEQAAQAQTTASAAQAEADTAKANAAAAQIAADNAKAAADQAQADANTAQQAAEDAQAAVAALAVRVTKTETDIGMLKNAENIRTYQFYRTSSSAGDGNVIFNNWGKIPDGQIFTAYIYDSGYGTDVAAFGFKSSDKWGAFMVIRYSGNAEFYRIYDGSLELLS